jgi:hypothetical protein
MRAIIAALFAVLLALAAPANARPTEVARTIPAAQQVGEASYRFLAWTLFDAALWAPEGEFSWNGPFALTLTYQRSFSANDLATRTLAEMAQRGSGDASTLGPLQTPLTGCFADVTPGDRITGVSSGPNTARFYFNGRERCELEWPEFRRQFFGIWLDASGSNRALSNQLRGVA